MRVLRYTLLAATILAGTHTLAQDAYPPDDSELLTGDAELPGLDFAIEDADIPSGFMQRLSDNWPEDLVIAPIPGFSPQLGWNLTVGAAYFIDRGEEDDPASTVGVFGMIAENGSYVYGTGASLHLLGDKLRIKAGALDMSLRYRFYGIGNELGDLGVSVNLIQDGPGYFAKGSWRVWKDLFVGIGYLRGSVDTRLRLELEENPFFDPVLSLDLAAIVIPIEYDSRDHQHFPRSGWKVSLDGTLYRKSVGSDFDSDIFKLAVNNFLPMREEDVLASRVVIKSSSEGTPFFLKSSFGGNKDLRGYPSGRYRDRKVIAVQTEYRWKVSERWIVTGFAGVGEVAETFSDFGRNLLPAAGVGARFILSGKHKVSLSADLAAGKDGAEFYFGINEAF